MKVILFFPEMYSIHHFLMNGLKMFNYDVRNIDYPNLLSKSRNTIFNKTAGLPARFNHKIVKKYIEDINKRYLEIILADKPEFIIIYNNQYFLPETLNIIKSNTKIVFILGDNPLYSHTSDSNLLLLKYADLIISPDSFWTMQLSKIGIKHIITDRWGYQEGINYRVDDIRRDLDTVFIGGNYKGAAGYKRTAFYNELSNLDFQLHGPKIWSKWLTYFPDLKEKFILQNQRYDDNKVNELLNRSKVYLIENNPGLFNGIHIRFFECIGSGVLPIPEHSKDLEFYTREFGLPTIEHISEISVKAEEYINNEDKRLHVLMRIKEYVDEEYSPSSFIGRIIELLN